MLLTFKLVAGLNTPTVYVYNSAEHLTQLVMMFVMVSYVFMFLSTDWLLFSDYLLIMCSCLYNSFDKFHV